MCQLSAPTCVSVCPVYGESSLPWSLEEGHASRAAQIARGAAKRKFSSSACELDREGDELRKIGGSGAAVKNSMRDVIRSMNRLGYSVSVPIRYVPTVYVDEGDVQHPVISLLDMLDFMLKQHSSLLLGGHSLEDASCSWKVVLLQFWRRYQWHDPAHVFFQEVHRNETHTYIPLLVYGDEGTGKRKQPVWLLCWKPVLFAATDSMHRTMLYTCASHTLYSEFHCGMAGGNRCLDPLVDAFAIEAQKAYTEGGLVKTRSLHLPHPRLLNLSLSRALSRSLSFLFPCTIRTHITFLLQMF